MSDVTEDLKSAIFDTHRSNPSIGIMKMERK